MVKKAVILCGGMATRFLPFSKAIPKEMLPLLDKPILQILVEQLKDAGITDVIIVLGRGKESIIRHFDRNVELEDNLRANGKLDLIKTVNEPNNLVNMYFRMQDAPIGTGHSIKLVRSFVENEPFVLLFGDEIILCEGKNGINQLIENFNKFNKDVIAVQRCDWKDVHKYGIIKPKEISNGIFEVLDMVEKPKNEEAPSNISYIGPAILTNEVFKKLDTLEEVTGKEFYLTEAFIELAKENKLLAQEINGTRFDMGNKFGFVKANVIACLHDETVKNEMKDFIKELVKELE